MTERTRRFEASVLPHLNAAYNLARWLLRDESDAQDVVQEAFLRAFRFFDGFRGGDARPWLLGIVRNTCFTLLAEKKQAGDMVDFDDERDSGAIDPAFSRPSNNPESLLLRSLDRVRIDAAIERLAPVYREVLVLRELEELSYDEIARVVAIPVGTVMSRLARARAQLRAALTLPGQEDEQWKITKIRS